MAFNKYYFLITLLIFCIEAIIAIYCKGSFIRQVFGDYLVVVFIYCFVRSFTSFSILKTAIGTLFFAYSIEILQGINLIKLLGYQRSTFTDLTLGSTFDWGDMLAYTLGITTVLIIEYLCNKGDFIKKNK